MDSLITYIIFWVIWILAVFAFVIWTDQMVKVILWNYVLWIICMAASQSIDILINFLANNANLSIMSISYDTLASFFNNGKITFVLLLYALWLILIYKKSTISISFPSDPNLMRTIQILLVPMTVISMILTLQMAIIWVNMIDAAKLQVIVSWFSQTWYLYEFLRLWPVWLLLHGVLTTIISSELHITVRSD